MCFNPRRLQRIHATLRMTNLDDARITHDEGSARTEFPGNRSQFVEPAGSEDNSRAAMEIKWNYVGCAVAGRVVSSDVARHAVRWGLTHTVSANVLGE
jgi:hypothetical protein